MILRSLLTAAALAATVFFAMPSAAQTAQADTTRLSTALWTECPGATVRVTTASADTVTGRCGRVQDGRLTVRVEDAEREIRFADVQTLHVRKSRMTQMTVLLSIVGTAAGWAFGLQGEERTCVPGARVCVGENRNVELARGAGVGAVVGAATGLFIGSRMKHWQPRYP
ncbi:MAG TPA: hypothetical protein VLK84_28640 [Longimicrobium sp.]|nr:hypothetical protein [Longimicrobium sp.]